MNHLELGLGALDGREKFVDLLFLVQEGLADGFDGFGLLVDVGLVVDAELLVEDLVGFHPADDMVERPLFSLDILLLLFNPLYLLFAFSHPVLNPPDLLLLHPNPLPHKLNILPLEVNRRLMLFGLFMHLIIVFTQGGEVGGDD